MKYFGHDTRQDLIDDIVECGHFMIFYKQSTYTFWRECDDFVIGRTDVDGLEHTQTIKSYTSIENLIKEYVLYDGISLANAIEMDI